MEGAGTWEATPLSITDLALIQQYVAFRTSRGRLELSPSQHIHITTILRHYTDHLQPDPWRVLPTLALDSSWSLQLLIDLFQLPFVLVEHSDDCYEVVATTDFDIPIHSLGAHSILPPALSGSHTLVFQTHHVRLINWRSHCPAIAHIATGECWRNIRRLDQLDIDTGRPVGSNRHARRASRASSLQTRQCNEAIAQPRVYHRAVSPEQISAISAPNDGNIPFVQGLPATSTQYFSQQLNPNLTSLFCLNPILVPECSGYPFDCGIWHAALLIRLRIFAGTKSWPLTPLTLSDLTWIRDYASYYAERGRLGLDSSQWDHLHTVLDNYQPHLETNHIQTLPALTLESSITAKLLMDLFQLPVVLIQTSTEPPLYELVSTADDVVLDVFITGRIPARWGSQTLVFQQNHVRLMKWADNCLVADSAITDDEALGPTNHTTTNPYMLRRLDDTEFHLNMPVGSSGRNGTSNDSSPDELLCLLENESDRYLADYCPSSMDPPPDGWYTDAQVDSLFTHIDLHPHVYGVQYMQFRIVHGPLLDPLLLADTITEPMLADTLPHISPIVIQLHASCERTDFPTASSLQSLLSLLHFLYMQEQDPTGFTSSHQLYSLLLSYDMSRQLLKWLEDLGRRTLLPPQIALLAQLLREGPSHWNIPNPIDSYSLGTLFQCLRCPIRFWLQTENGGWTLRRVGNPDHLPHNSGADFLSPAKWINIGYDLIGTYCLLSPPLLYGIEFWNQVIAAALLPSTEHNSTSSNSSQQRLHPISSEINWRNYRSLTPTSVRRAAYGIAQTASLPAGHPHGQPTPFHGKHTTYTELEAWESSWQVQPSGSLHITEEAVEACLPSTTNVLLLHPHQGYSALYLLFYLEQGQYGALYATQLPRRIPLQRGLAAWLLQLINTTSIDSWLTSKLERLQLSSSIRNISIIETATSSLPTVATKGST